MPSTKRKQTYDRSDSFVVSGPDSPPSAKKRSKANAGFTSASSLPISQTDADGNPYWSISNARRVTVSEFKGKKMVSIREYYEKDGTWLPGKKGITMTLEQYAELIKVMPQIESALGKEGDAVGRPDYGERNGAVTNGEDQSRDRAVDSEDEDGKGEKKANIEATSDEDED